MKKILFIAAHRPDRSPSQRFRFEQYFDYLQKNGFQCDLSYLISEHDDKYFYQPGNFFYKSYLFFKAVLKRLRDISQSNNYDIVFVQREAFMTGSVYFEKQLSRSKAKLVFDFDDAIWLFDVSDANKKLGWLKRPAKTSDIISLADLVIAGNDYLSGYAKKYNPHTIVIPTTIDTNYHKSVLKKKSNNKICIGWTGSLTTIKHFKYALPILTELEKKFGNKICFRVVGDGSYTNSELGIKGIPWKRETEIEDLYEIDIGIMPLPNDEWAKGKCGLKGLSYMALEIPTVMSPVGVNTGIISDGVNGFLASTTEEWVEKVSRLIESGELRKKIGTEARKTVVEKYSVISQREKYLQCFRELTLEVKR